MRPGELDQLPTGAIVGTAILTRCNLITEAFVAKLTPMELALGDFTLGRYAWDFHVRIAADSPVPAKGMQGLWEWRAAYETEMPLLRPRYDAADIITPVSA